MTEPANNRPHQRFGPICYGAVVLGALFGAVAVLLTAEKFPYDVARSAMVGGVWLGAMIGVGLGVAWENDRLPRKRIIAFIKWGVPWARRGLVVLLVAALVFAGMRMREAHLMREFNKTLIESGASPSLDRSTLSFDGQHVVDANLAYVRDLRGVRDLWIYDTLVRGPGLSNISHWTSLRTLSIANSPVGDEGLEHLKSLKGLQFLQLEGIEASLESIESLRRALPDCEIVTL